uniref:Uncharacterized protein n=1 Tax=Anopheles quadriannulatus TaxID=34691 RepID=A0A182XRC6_ANOQN
MQSSSLACFGQIPGWIGCTVTSSSCTSSRSPSPRSTRRQTRPCAYRVYRPDEGPHRAAPRSSAQAANAAADPSCAFPGNHCRRTPHRTCRACSTCRDASEYPRTDVASDLPYRPPDPPCCTDCRQNVPHCPSADTFPQCH